MVDNLTPAHLLLDSSGRTFWIAGTTFASVGVLYGTHRITGTALKALRRIPYWCGLEKDTGQLDTKLEITKENVWHETSMYFKIAMVILAGIAFKYVGKHLSSSTTIDFFDKILYKS